MDEDNIIIELPVIKKPRNITKKMGRKEKHVPELIKDMVIFHYNDNRSLRAIVRKIKDDHEYTITVYKVSVIIKKFLEALNNQSSSQSANENSD